MIGKKQTNMLEAASADEQQKVRKGFHVFVDIFLATVCGLTFGFTVSIFLFSMVSDNMQGMRDGGLYWATGQQLVRHANPYDVEVISRIERVLGHPLKYRGLMRNPPWALPIVYPFGFMGLRASSILWNFVLMGCLAISVHLFWIMQGRPGNSRLLLGYTFAPALICLNRGQVSLLVLVGLVLFLRLHRTRPFLSGLSLWLCMLKPHLFLPFGVVLLAWILVSKNYRILAGAAAAMAASSAIISFLDPMAWIQYVQMMRYSGIKSEFIPCVSDVVRLLISEKTLWLRYLPALLGCVWALAYFWPRRQTWDWIKDGSLLMLVSILVAPYSWLYDQVLVIPALLYGVYLTRSRFMLAALASLSALIEIGLFSIVWKHTTLYFWTLWSAPAWLIWYVIACHSGKWFRTAEKRLQGEEITAKSIMRETAL